MKTQWLSPKKMYPNRRKKKNKKSRGRMSEYLFLSLSQM